MATSYSQNGEDTVLYEKYLCHVSPGERIYMEMGAMDGIKFSNTKMLEDSYGWTGILVEPHPLNYELLTQNRPENHLFNCIVSAETDPLEFRYFVGPNLRAVSAVTKTLTPALIKQYYDPETDNQWMRGQQEKNLRTMMVTPRSLTDIVQASGLPRITFFSLDVEGHEYQVLQSYDWSVPIDYILVEENKDQRVDDLLSREGYRFVEALHNNRLYHLHAA